MSETSYPISISGRESLGIPNIEANFGRITVLIGANGSGKSKVLQHMVSMDSEFGDLRRPVTFIEGGRVINIPAEMSFDNSIYNEFSTPTQAEHTIRQKKRAPAVDRVRHVLFLLDRMTTDVKVQHSDAVTAWQEAGAQGACPIPEEAPLLKLFRMFSEVFPEIRLSYNKDTNWLGCYRNNSFYPPSHLSDGERQTFFILADVLLTTAADSLIIVDEPELNLNARLADRLWNTIEDSLPNAIFVYATHSIGFAMRQNVDKVIALSSRGLPAIVVDDINQIPPHDVREFLGSIPAIISSPGALAVEGIDTSFDGGFYRWVVGNQEIAVVPLGGNTDVTAAVTRRGIWEKLAPEVKLAGVIDRDYRSDTQLSESDGRCIVLDYHEAESYLCEPILLSTLANALGIAEPLPTVEELESVILTYFNSGLLRIAVNRMARRAQIRLGVSLPKVALKNINDEQSLRQVVEQEAIREEAKAGKVIGSAAVLAILEAEIKRCRTAYDDKKIEEILKLAPGKELLDSLAHRIGCKDSAAVARAAFKHLDVGNFKNLAALRTRINSALFT